MPCAALQSDRSSVEETDDATLPNPVWERDEKPPPLLDQIADPSNRLIPEQQPRMTFRDDIHDRW